MLSLKAKGDLAELKVAADLVARGHKVALPYGEDWDFDLILSREGALERVQVKYARSDGSRLVVRCRSHSLTAGKVRRTKCYTAESIDWLAEMTLRLRPARNNQLRRLRPAARYTSI